MQSSGRPHRETGGAFPFYPVKHSGVCLIAGNAWTLPDDLGQAHKLYGDVPVIAVNGAAAEVKAFALFSFHPDHYLAYGYEWIRKQRKIHTDFTVHGGSTPLDMPHVQHWWPHARGGGGSAWGARKMAWYMGFDTVVLVGCPLLPGNYAGHKPGMLMAKDAYTGGYASWIEGDKAWHEGACSLSGRTMEILGAPYL